MTDTVSAVAAPLLKLPQALQLRPLLAQLSQVFFPTKPDIVSSPMSIVKMFRLTRCPDRSEVQSTTALRSLVSAAHRRHRATREDKIGFSQHHVWR